MPLTDAELNRIVNEITDDAWTAYAHTGAPGNLGTANRIPSVSATLAAASWSEGASGDVRYNQPIAFGVLDAAQARTVTHITCFRGADYVGYAAMSSNVVVAAGSSFSVNSGTLRINGSST